MAPRRSAGPQGPRTKNTLNPEYHSDLATTADVHLPIERSVQLTLRLSCSLFISISSPRRPDRGAAPAPLAGPGAAVALVPDELRGLGVTPDGPGALGVTPGLVCGAGGVCGTGIAEIPGCVPTVPRPVAPPGAPPVAPPAAPPPPAPCARACGGTTATPATNNAAISIVRIIASTAKETDEAMPVFRSVTPP